MIDQDKFGKRQWIKVWTLEWLDGTTRFEMTGAQRAFWIDLLAMAGRSRYPGIICAGYSGDRIVGYPLSRFQGLDTGGELDIPATFRLFEACGKIRVEVTQESPIRLVKVEILNWSKYQSNLAQQADRQRRYRQNKVSRDIACDSHASVTGVEVDVEGEEEKPLCANQNRLHESVPSKNTAKPSNGNLAAVKRVWSHYIEKLGKDSRLLTLTTARKQKGLARLAECLNKTGDDLVRAEALMCCAVDALAGSRYHCGDNDKKTKYDSWEGNLFKSQEQLEKWLERA